MDKKIFRDISYGMYFVSSMIDEKMVGCVINTLCQITSNNPVISISLNKDNYTSEVISKSKKFSVAVISNDTEKDVIGKFGYYTSKNIDKFDNIKFSMVDSVPVVEEDICGYLVCEVMESVDCGTHNVIIAKVVDSKKVSDKVPMTYKYYHENLKGVSPKNAPTYIEEVGDDVKNTNKYRCKLCGYVYDDSVEKVKFEDLPDTWKCPLCGAPKSCFEKI